MQAYGEAGFSLECRNQAVVAIEKIGEAMLKNHKLFINLYLLVGEEKYWGIAELR